METFSSLLALCDRKLPVIGEFPSQKPATWNLNVLVDLCLNIGLSKQSRRQRFETPSRSLGRHCNGVLYGMSMLQDERIQPVCHLWNHTKKNRFHAGYAHIISSVLHFPDVLQTKFHPLFRTDLLKDKRGLKKKSITLH